jgi:hypothetical protein
MKLSHILFIVTVLSLLLVACSQEQSKDATTEKIAKLKAAKGVQAKQTNLAGQAVSNMQACLDSGCPDSNWPGDNWCDPSCNTAACSFDDGDCGLSQDTKEDYECAPGCPNNWKNDGYCDFSCDNDACQQDGGDCSDPCLQQGCYGAWLGDGECDFMCDNAACNFDAKEGGKSDCTLKKAGDTCYDGVKNQDETDVDCGGVCVEDSNAENLGYCEVGKSCTGAPDCLTSYCENGVCAAAKSCYDSDNGNNFFEKGTTTDPESAVKGVATGEGTDSCTGKKLTEFSCKNDILTSETITCTIGCSDGACIKNIQGDAWLVATSSKKLEISNNNITPEFQINGESISTIVDFIDDSDLQALADGTYKTNEKDYDYEQFLFFDKHIDGIPKSRIIKYAEDDDDVSSDFFNIKDGQQIARYKLEFTTSAVSDVTDGTGTVDKKGTVLDDFVNTALSMVGIEYDIILAERVDSGADGLQNGIKLTLMSGTIKDTLLEGGSKKHVLNKDYNVKLFAVTSSDAKFVVNGETTTALKAGETFVLSDGYTIGVSEILYQAYAGGVHSATFFLGAEKMVLQDNDVTNDKGDTSLKVKVGTEDIDGTQVIIRGIDDNSQFKLNAIEVNMTADDDYFVGSGEKLSDVITAAGEDKDVLFTKNWDIAYSGLTEESTHDLQLDAIGKNQYNLIWYDGNDNKVEMPFVRTTDVSKVSFGKVDGGKLVLKEHSPIKKGDYFVVTGGNPILGTAKSFLLQYLGADKSTSLSPKISFKDIGSGETLIYSTKQIGNLPSAGEIKLGGHSFVVSPLAVHNVDDYDLLVDANGDGYEYSVEEKADSKVVELIVDSFGAQLKVNEYKEGNLDKITLTLSTPNGDDYDTIKPSDLILDITAKSGTKELRAQYSGMKLLTPDGEKEIGYGYTSMGAKVTFKEPSGEPDSLTVNYPKKQRLPRVWITSGVTIGGSS